MNNKYPLYLSASIRVLKERKQEQECNNERKDTLLRVVFYGIKSSIYTPESINYEQALTEFQFISAMKDIIAKVTPNEFMSVFPVEKYFKGYKHDMKDYYSTMEYLSTLNLDEPLGEGALMFLAEYMNNDVHRFFVRSVVSLSSLRQYEGHIDMYEEFMAAQGANTPNTFKNNKGEPMYLRNGKPEAIGFKTNKLELVK